MTSHPSAPSFPSLMLELGQVLDLPHLRVALPRALGVLAGGFGAVAGVVVVADAESGDLLLEAGQGLGRTAVQRMRWKPGEGITTRVVQSNRPVVVPRAGQEPLLQSAEFVRARRSRREDVSFVCVPVTFDGRPAGALGLALPFQPGRDHENDAKLLQVAASMLGQALKAARLVETDRKRLLDENRQLRRELRERYDLGNIVGNSPPMEQVYELVAQAAPATATVLVRGEPGTGKELIAHAIHRNSPRAERPFVKVSCSAFPETFVESELFGHEPDALTDTRARKQGRFELAHGGTLFLDEVGELGPATQVKLLRVLVEREFERLGGREPVRIDVRLIAATNKDLEAAIRAGSFREDLYYRLNVFEICVPPLRERRSDILLLADHFVETYSIAHGKVVKRIATSAIDMLTAYHWPGNVRELENCIERATLVCEGGVIHAHHLPPTLQTAEVSGTLPRTSLGASVTAFERDLLLDALKSARGNRARAARLLQTTERIFNYKIRKYGLDAHRFRS